VLLFLVQFGTAHLQPARESVVEPLLALGVALAAGVLVFLVVVLTVTRSRRLARHWRDGRRRRRLRDAASAEQRARVLMSELCPHGWRAQVTLFGSDEERRLLGPERDSDRVALDWIEYEDSRGRVAVERRVWAPTIAEALDAMIADRRTDETLEEIERGVVGDGGGWPEV
jgi:hypothetical protein